MVRLQFLAVVLTLSGVLSSLSAQCVRFDVPHTAAAEDITTPEFLAVSPGEKLVRIRLPISSLVQLETESPLLQYLYSISGTTQHPFTVVDYAPKTTLTTDVNGFIATEHGNEESTSIGVNALVPREIPLKADATAKHNTGHHASERMERLPPKQLLSASGTMHRGTSVYFKLKPSSQTTLEGDKHFEIVARVKDSWRASMLYVRCSAFTKPKQGGFSEKSSNVCGQRGFVVGVHLAGDELARSRVQRLAESQSQLHVLADQHSRFIEEKRFPSIGHKFGAMLSVVKPRIPDHWLNQLLTSGDFHPFERHLPQSIRAAATDYRQARAEVIGFSG